MTSIIDQTRPDQTRPDQHYARNSTNRKILLLTIYEPVGNFGNILQHYALQETLKLYEFHVESLLCPRVAFFRDKITGFTKRVVKTFLAILGVKPYRQRLMEKFHAFRNRPDKAMIQRRQKNYLARREFFNKFYEERISGKIYMSLQAVLTSNKSHWENYSYAVVGSDQVWNKHIVCSSMGLKVYYLTFMERDKRLNYAPSFGVDQLALCEKLLHKKYLKGFHRLSCREKSGCELIRQLTGRNAELVLDPTLLLKPEQWRKISHMPSYRIPEHYALVYFLGDMDRYSDAIRKIIGNLEIIDIYNPDDAEHFMTGPEEFIWLIDHADYVVTNSFHGTAFSVNMGKNFTSFGKNAGGWFESVFSRIGDLLSSLELTDRIYEDGHEISSGPIDYQGVREKLNALRESSLKYLCECLEISG